MSWRAALTLATNGFFFFPWATVQACDTPVFRYALQNWPPDDYEVIVVHRGEEEAETALGEWREAAREANVVVREVNLSEKVGASYATLLAETPPTTLPWVYLRYPVRANARQMVWAGPYEKGQSRPWRSSPLREAIARELGAGKAGVWLFLESGNRQKDETAFTLLARELTRLEQVLVVPSESGMAEGHFSFSILRLGSENREEETLRMLLLGSEPDLRDHLNEPMVFPIFGRGIVLYALIGRGINERTITETAEFLTGPCACEIKSQNPGLELLMRADWEEGASTAGGVADFFQRGEETRERIRKVEEATVVRMGRADVEKTGPENVTTCSTFVPVCPLWAGGCPPMAILFLAAAGFLTIALLRRIRRSGGAE